MSLIDDLKRHEGLRLKPYIDTVGKLTVGYGRNLDDVGISEQEAEMMLRQDIYTATAEAREAFPWVSDISPIRQDVIYNMSFNMGMPKLKKFKNMIAALEHRDFGEAAKQMLDSRWAKQVGSRATELAEIMRSGQ